MPKGRDKRRRADRKKGSQDSKVAPLTTGDPVNFAEAPFEPKAHRRSDAIPLVEPAENDDLSQAAIRIGEISGSPIVERIILAFASAEHPGDSVIPSRIDSVDEEPEKFRYLKGRSWRDLELDRMAGLSDVLMWLSSEGLRYYLPAFLAAAIATPTIQGSADIIGFLAPPGRKDSRGHFFWRLVAGLTSDQKNVVRECLQHLRVNMEGLFSYWNTE
jgi:hypothetical protein